VPRCAALSSGQVSPPGCLPRGNGAESTTPMCSLRSSPPVQATTSPSSGPASGPRTGSGRRVKSLSGSPGRWGVGCSMAYDTARAGPLLPPPTTSTYRPNLKPVTKPKVRSAILPSSEVQPVDLEKSSRLDFGGGWRHEVRRRGRHRLLEPPSGDGDPGRADECYEAKDISTEADSAGRTTASPVWSSG
jgi:hypothetical protein